MIQLISECVFAAVPAAWLWLSSFAYCRFIFCLPALNVAILVAIAVNEDGYHEVLGAAEGMKEDKASWVSFFQWLRGRGLDGVKLIVWDKCLGMMETVGEVFPEVKYQRCIVHFYCNVFSVTPRSKMKLVAKMLKAIYAQKSKKAVWEKTKMVVEELRSMKLKEVAKKVEDGIEETLTYCDFPANTGLASAPTMLLRGWTVRSAVVPVWWAVSQMEIPPSCWSVPSCAMWLAPIGATRSTWIWSTWRRFLRTPLLLADFIHARVCKPKCENILTLPI